MPVHNADVAAVFEQIADLLEIQGENPFRVRAYRNGARVVQGLPQELSATLRETGGALPRLPGIGKDLAAKIGEIIDTGSCALLRRLQNELPAAITEMLKIPGVGPKRVRALYNGLHVQTMAQLADAARGGRVAGLPGFGPLLQRKILDETQARQNVERRFKLATAAQYAETLVAYLRETSGVKQTAVAGSYRRMRETVGDLDILVAADAGERVMRRFIAYDEITRVLASGPTRASVVLKFGVQVDLRVVEPRSWGAALHYFTGSKAHNIAIRRLGAERGLKINEYGVFRGTRRIAGDTEESVFAAVGLPWIAPELREAQGEIEAAQAGHLPQLIECSDLRGDLHVHTQASDGHDTLRAMALAAKRFGLSYIAITEHSHSLTVAHGLDAARLAQQGLEIDRLNATLGGITVLKGIEVDILGDGSLDLPEAALRRLDIVVGAVHSRFDLTRAQQTARIVRAVQSGLVTILAHPSGRLIDERLPYDADMEVIIRAARAAGCFLELNAHPDRLDLDDARCRMARTESAKVCINSDSHRATGFGNLRFGIGQARRGWLEAADVVNTLPRSAFMRTIQAQHATRRAMATV